MTEMKLQNTEPASLAGDCLEEEIRFNRYVFEYDLNDEQIKLKVIHTWKVVQAADAIAQSLNLDPAQKRQVHLAALFHDIGRFEQVRQYHTFFDAQSIDHAALGAQILEQEHFLDQLDDRTRAQIIEAVRVHNRLNIPDDHQGFQRILDQIVRDADKVDIFRVGAQDSPEANSGYSLDTIGQDRISAKVSEAIFNGTSVKREDRCCPLDFWVACFGFAFDLNYPEAARLILASQDWKKPLLGMLDEKLITDEGTRKLLLQLMNHTQNQLEDLAIKPNRV